MTMWELVSVLSKALIYSGMLAVAGGMLVLWMSRQSTLSVQIISRSYLLPAVLAGLLATCLLFLIQIGSVNQRGIAGMFDPVMGGILADTELGAAVRWRLAGFMLALMALLPLNLPGFPFQYTGPRLFSLLLALAACVCFAVAVSSQGHASAISPLAELLAAVHLLAVACWAGALYPLYLLVSRLPDAQRQTVTEPGGDVTSLLERFGIYAWAILGVMLLSGISLIWLLTGGLVTLFDNLHGQLLLIKMLLVAGMMTLGALHKFRWVPRLRAIAESDGDMQPVLVPLARSIRLETALALLVLVLTASLTTITGPSA